MSADAAKFTREQIETLEIAPAAERSDLQGWVPELAGDEDLRRALERAFDYRGDVTLTLKSGERVEAYIFDRQSGATLQDSRVQYFTANAPRLALGALAFVSMCAGVVVLTRTAPATMSPSPAVADATPG